VRRTRVMFFTVAFEEGGGERLYVNLLRNLDAERFDLSLVCWKVHESHFVEELPDWIPVVDLDRRGRWRKDLPRLIAQTSRLLRQLRPHCVHAISTEMNAGLFAAHALARSRARIVLNEQGSPSGWLDLVRAEQPRRARLSELAYRRLALPRSDRVVCVSEPVRRDLVERFGADPGLLVTIPNPLDVDRIRALAREPAGHPWLDEPDRPVVVSVGRFFPQKGYDVLARAFVELAKRTEARLVLVGDGPERAVIEGILAEGGVLDRAAFVGYRANPFPVVARSTVFALPSLTEGFGYVLVEAMALGVPAVSTACAGPTDLLGGGRYGKLVPPGSESELADALAALLGDEPRRVESARAASLRAEEYGLQRVLADYTEVLAGP
jgi:glycosyltransferase involved in cell wall biosynthesis